METVLQPTWVAVAGFGFEKIHTGVIAYLLSQEGEASKQLLAAFWQKLTGKTINPSQIGKVSALREKELGKGHHSVIDLLIEFSVDNVSHRIAIEMKVDARADRHQLGNYWNFMGGYPKEHQALLLITLGGAQVYHCDLPNNMPVTNWWRIEDLLPFSEQMLAVGRGDIVEPWLFELAAEKNRKDNILSLMNYASAGYRGREREGYYWAKWAPLLTTFEPWLVYPTANNMVMHGLGSRREIPTLKGKLTLYLEFVCWNLCVKAGLWENPKQKARGPSQPTATTLDQSLKSVGLTPEKPVQKDGNSVTLFKFPLRDLAHAQSLLAQIKTIWP